MAELPVQPAETAPMPGGNFLRGALGMPMVRQMTLLIALAASVAIAVTAMMWMQTPDFRPVSDGASPGETNEIIDALDAKQIQYKLDERTGMLLVPVDAYYRARMAMAEADVIDGRQQGYEILDQEQGFGVSRLMESARLRRAVEGELTKHITSIVSVQAARVILATPKAPTFMRDRRKPSASVTVTLKRGRQLEPSQIRGITNVVANAVPELESKNVVVIDQSGALLSDGADDPAVLRRQQDLELQRIHEAELREKIANILAPWIGVDRFTAEVNADMDFTRTEQTEELYNPDLTALRSEQRIEEQNLGNASGVGGAPGTLSNQPPVFGEVADGEQAAAPAQSEQMRSSSVRATRNFEVDKTISHTRHQVGTITRLSVAVVVDDRPVVDAATGEAGTEPWSQEELDGLAQQVRMAVGFRADRGDSVSVSNRAFFRQPEEAIAEIPIWEQHWFSEIIKQVLGGLAIIIVVFGLLRPLYKNLSQAGEMVREQQSMAIADLAQAREAALAEAVPGLPTRIDLDPDESSAVKMETVRNLITDDPDRVAQVVKHWVNEEEQHA